MPGPLEGVKVVELAAVIMAPFSTQLLADLGATVIKVEPPVGEIARHYPGGRHPGMPPLFMNSNKGKKDIALDLRDPQDYQYFIELLQYADIFVTNQRPKSLEKLKIDYDSVKNLAPRLVYCSAQGFRLDSELRDEPAYDEVIQSISGLTSTMEKLTGYPNCYPSIVADKICGLAIVSAALAALYHQQKTGEGQFVNVPMADTMFAFNMPEHLAKATFSNLDDPRTPDNEFGYPIAFVKYHGDSPAKDGNISLHPYSMDNIKAIVKAAGREDLIESDPYFSDWANFNADARNHLYEIVHEVAPKLTVKEWMDVAAKNGIPAAIPTSLDDVAANDYIRSGRALVSLDHPTEGQILAAGYPIEFSATPVKKIGIAPTLNHDKEEILNALKQAKDSSHKKG